MSREAIVEEDEMEEEEEEEEEGESVGRSGGENPGNFVRSCDLIFTGLVSRRLKTGKP